PDGRARVGGDEVAPEPGDPSLARARGRVRGGRGERGHEHGEGEERPGGGEGEGRGRAREGAGAEQGGAREPRDDDGRSPARAVDERAGDRPGADLAHPARARREPAE